MNSWRHFQIFWQKSRGGGAAAFRRGGGAVSAAGRRNWETSAVFLKNECVRFEKRLRSFFETSAFVF